MTSFLSELQQVQPVEMFRRILSKRIRPVEDTDFEVGRQVRRRLNFHAMAEKADREEPKVQVIGVSADDLPIPPKTITNNFKAYDGLPVVRKLDWHVNEKKEPIRRDLKGSQSLLAGFAQTRGFVALVPCDYCRSSRGPWQSCVIGTDINIDTTTHGSCANCRFSRKGHICSIRTNVFNFDHPVMSTENGDRSSDEISSIPSDLSLSPVPAEWDGFESETEEKATSPGNAMNENTRTPTIKDEYSPNRNALNNLIANPMNTSNSRLKGRVIPFPLGPETIDDLQLLKIAAKDMIAHLDVINRRIEQLESKDRDRKEFINPWELV
ncbi:hypothetical protein MW887_011185 [Aspergillus wentii]|nr:hypothetical protein MW887_011185 [Aspergillus wentii]